MCLARHFSVFNTCHSQVQSRLLLRLHLLSPALSTYPKTPDTLPERQARHFNCSQEVINDADAVKNNKYYFLIGHKWFFLCETTTTRKKDTEWSSFLFHISINYVPSGFAFKLHIVQMCLGLSWACFAEKECPLLTTGDCWPSQTEQSGWKYMWKKQF